MFDRIMLIDYKRSVRETSRHAYFWQPPKTPSGGRGFYSSSKNWLAMDKAGSSLDLRLEDANEHLGHTRLANINGYYCDEYEDQTLAPIIARLPKSRGFLAGWSMGAGMCGTLDGYVYATEEDAARAAHNLAESDAEKEREYQASQQSDED